MENRIQLKQEHEISYIQKQHSQEALQKIGTVVTKYKLQLIHIKMLVQKQLMTLAEVNNAIKDDQWINNSISAKLINYKSMNHRSYQYCNNNIMT